MFGTPRFEIDEDGRPWWIAPGWSRPSASSAAPTSGAVLVDAIAGEHLLRRCLEVDNVYTPELIMEQYDYHGTLVNGFINSSSASGT